MNNLSDLFRSKSIRKKIVIQQTVRSHFPYNSSTRKNIIKNYEQAATTFKVI